MGTALSKEDERQSKLFHSLQYKEQGWTARYWPSKFVFRLPESLPEAGHAKPDIPR
jgi:hypothetical protein